MWKNSIRNIVVIFQPNILRIVGFYVRHSANIFFKEIKKFCPPKHKKTALKFAHNATRLTVFSPAIFSFEKLRQFF